MIGERARRPGSQDARERWGRWRLRPSPGAGPAGRLLALLRGLVSPALFALAFGQAPLYSQNQNDRFLHGLANAGYGLLRDDWLAQTPDPFPVFSALVAGTHLLLPTWSFHLYQAAILGLYLVSLRGIAAAVAGVARGTAAWYVLTVGLFALHARLLETVWPAPAAGQPPLTPAALTGGLAGYYLLGQVFQPSVFGVLLLASLYRWVRGSIGWAIVLAGVATVLHPSYLLAAGVLLSAYLVGSLGAGRRIRELVPSLGLAAILCALSAAYAVLRFGPTSADASHAANDVLVNFRSPHELLIRQWLDAEAGVQVAIMLAGLLLARRTCLLAPPAALFAVGATLTLVQAVTGSLALAVVSPWRLSVVLVPVSSALLVARLARLLARPAAPGEPAPLGVRAASGALVAALAVGGTAESLVAPTRSRPEVAGVTQFVGETKRPGELYLLSERRRYEFQDFRLATGAPILADIKAHPWRDVDVLEWYARVRFVREFARGERSARCDLLADASARYGVTHVVMWAGQPEARCPGIVPRYADARYTVASIDRSR